MITIEGTTTPSTFLARGARRTVTRTPFIDRLIRKGFVRVVSEDASKTEVLRQEIADSHESLHAAQLEQQLTEPEPPEEPDEDAPKSRWREFLDAQHISYPESATKADLIARWYIAQVSDG